MGYECNRARELDREISVLGKRINSDNYRFLMLLGEFDEVEGYLEFGMRSCAEWLSWRCGVARGTAGEKVRVAKALRRLPKVGRAMQEGEISYCMARSITRIATEDNEEMLLKVAETGNVKQVEGVVSRMRRGDAREELERGNARHSSRYAQSYVDEEGFWILRAESSPEAGALVHSALLAAMDELREARGLSCESEGQAAQMADALELLAERYLAGNENGTGGERHLIHVHIDERVLRDASCEGSCDIDGHAVAPAAVQRLCCDGSLVALVEDAAGRPIAIGKKTRAIPTRLRRALKARDRGCRFSGCCNERFVDAHHLKHWVNGGETRLENLMLLCRWHHRFVHEHGYQAVREEDGIRFEREGIVLGRSMRAA